MNNNDVFQIKNLFWFQKFFLLNKNYNKEYVLERLKRSKVFDLKDGKNEFDFSLFDPRITFYEIDGIFQGEKLILEIRLKKTQKIVFAFYSVILFSLTFYHAFIFELMITLMFLVFILLYFVFLYTKLRYERHYLIEVLDEEI